VKVKGVNTLVQKGKTKRWKGKPYTRSAISRRRSSRWPKASRST
jgi:ribosomal protein L23